MMNGALRWSCLLLLGALSQTALGQSTTRTPYAGTVVESIRENDPQTSTALFQAVRSLLNVGATEEAKTYFEKLANLPSSDEELAALFERFGPADILRIRREPGLQPQGAEFAQRILAAAKRMAQNPARLAELLHELAKGYESMSVDDRFRLVEQLARGRSDAAVAMLRRLSEAADDPANELLRDIWKLLGEDATGPLLGALRCPDLPLQMAAIEGLGRIGSEATLPHLVGVTLSSNNPEIAAAAQRALRRNGYQQSPSDAAHYLQQACVHRLQPLRGESGIQFRHTWKWNPNTREVTKHRHLRRSYALREANQLAHYLADYRSQYHWLFQISELALVHELTSDVKARLDLLERQASLDAEQLSFALGWSQKNDVPEAAIVACQALANAADPNVLYAQPGVPSPLLDALRSPNPRVQFAAGEALLTIDPQRPFVGANHLAEFAVTSIRSPGKRALIIDPNVTEAGDTAGLLASVGWRPEVVANGKEVWRWLTQTNDVEMILLSDRVVQPRYTELIQQLAAERHAAGIPVVITTHRRDLGMVEAVNPHSDVALVMPQPTDAAMVRSLERRVRKAFGNRTVSREQRMKVMLLAAEWLGKTADRLPTTAFYDLSRYDEQLGLALDQSEKQLELAPHLAKLGTAEIQAALLRAVRGHPADSPERELMRAALEEAARRRGLLLPGTELR